MRKLLATILVLGLSHSAQAGLILTLDDLSTVGIDVIIVDDADGGVGTATSVGNSNTADIAAGDGQVLFVGAVGTFSVNVTSGLSKPLLSPSLMNLTSVNVSGGTGGTIVISLTDTSFTGSGGLSTHFGGESDGNITYSAGFDIANAEFSMASGSTSFGFAGPGSFSGTQSIGTVLPGEDPYSLTQTLEITHTRGGQSTSGDFKVHPVPEPGIIGLLGIGLLGFGATRKQKRAS